MSIESAQSFMTRLTSDDEFRIQFELFETLEERLELAAKIGCDFTVDEWNTLVEQMRTESTSEKLSDEELETIAGGLVHPRAAYGRTAYTMGHISHPIAYHAGNDDKPRQW